MTIATATTEQTSSANIAGPPRIRKFQKPVKKSTLTAPPPKGEVRVSDAEGPSRGQAI
jgi:hypothetical protein